MAETPEETVKRLIPTGPIEAPLPKNGAFFRKPRTPVEGLTFEEDNNRGRRIRTTVHSEGVEREDVGEATGGDVRAVPSFGEMDAGEVAEMFEKMESDPARRPEAPDIKKLHAQGVNQSMERRYGRKTFGVPARPWKGEK